MGAMGKKDLRAKCCGNCIKGIPVGISNEILCREKGVVSSDYGCPGFLSFDFYPLKRQLDYRCSDCVYFNFTPNLHNPNYGGCSLYSLRQCDGSERKACSRFEKKNTRPA